MFLRSMLTGAALAALAATPAFGQGVTLAPLKPCYVAAQEDQTELITIDASPFTPGAIVDVYIDEVLQASPEAIDADPIGKVQGAVPAPFVESGEREFTLRLTQRNMPENTVTAVSRVTRFSVEQVPRSAKTDQRVRFRGRGFMEPRPVYAHYVFNGRVRKDLKLGMPKGNCGTFSVKRRQFPFRKRPRLGTWTIQFDQLPYYDPLTKVQVSMQIKVKRAIKPRRAQAH